MESGLDKLRDKNVAAMQRFVADARNQAFRDELTLDLEEGYQDSTYAMFDEVRVQIEEEDLAKNKERLRSFSAYRYLKKSQGLVNHLNHIGIVSEKELMN